MSTPDKIVVAGAGQAAFWLIKTLRQEGYAGSITLIGDEPYLPYDRPPLSKAVLTGEAEPHSTYYVDDADFAQFDVAFHRDVRVTAIDRANRTVATTAAGDVAYDALVLAAGTKVRRLTMPGADDAPIYYLRGIDDCLHLKSQLQPGKRVIVIGGGFIGLEVACAANKAGCKVTVIEAGDRVMARIAGPQISAFFEKLHRDHGTDVLTGTMPTSLETTASGSKVNCEDGTVVEGDIIVAGIGAIPNDEIATEAGLKTGNGIWVDEFTRTEDDSIYAIGDVTCHFNPRLDRRVRMETWQNAQNQGAACARIICGSDKPFADNPWGWTDQFGINLQMLGMPETFDNGVVRGDPGEGSFSVFYMDGERMTGANTVNAVRDMAVARRVMAMDMKIDPVKLADANIPLKELLGR